MTTSAPHQDDYGDLPAVLTVAEAADVLRCHTDSLYAAIKAGRLQVVSLGRAIRIPRHQLVAFLEGADDAD